MKNAITFITMFSIYFFLSLLSLLSGMGSNQYHEDIIAIAQNQLNDDKKKCSLFCSFVSFSFYRFQHIIRNLFGYFVCVFVCVFTGIETSKYISVNNIVVTNVAHHVDVLSNENENTEINEKKKNEN